MKIHEYQGKAVLAQYGVPVPKGKVAYTVDEAVEAGKGLLVAEVDPAGPARLAHLRAPAGRLRQSGWAGAAARTARAAACRRAD